MILFDNHVLHTIIPYGSWIRKDAMKMELGRIGSLLISGSSTSELSTINTPFQISQMQANFGTAKYFSKLDVKSGFHQKFFFEKRIGRRRHFRWTTENMNSAECHLDYGRILADSFSYTHMDDVIIYSPTAEEHIDILRCEKGSISATKSKRVSICLNVELEQLHAFNKLRNCSHQKK